MPNHPHPLGSLHLLGLDDRRLDLVLSLALLGLIAASRMLAFPASIWEQDEAWFAAAVATFDPSSNFPHPPWFPLWIVLGKLVHAAGPAPATALRLVSCAFSVWMIVPLTALWSAALPRRLALAAAGLALIVPGPWWLAGRAFSGTAATALLASALALWLHAAERSRWLAAGSAAAAAAVLVRPQLLPAALGALVMIAIRAKPTHRWLLIGAFGLPLAASVAGLAILAGGPEPLWHTLEAHAAAHFSQLDEATHGFARSGFVRSLGHPAVAVGWLLLLHVGMIRLVREHRWRDLSPVLIGAVLPTLVVVQLLSNPAHVRYAVPLVVLTAGPVVLGIETMARRWTWATLAVVGAAAAGAVGPQLGAYRSTVSPPIAALEAAITRAEAGNGTLVVDRTLHAFLIERESRRPIGAAVLFDHMIERGWAPPPPPRTTVFVVDAGHDAILVEAETRTRFTTDLPLARRLSQDRFLDLVVAVGARLRPCPSSSPTDGATTKSP
jgi:hypothetical protein